MKIWKTAGLILVSVLASFFIASMMNDFGEVTTRASAANAPTATPQRRVPADATPIKFFMPLIMNNAPTAINCITLASSSGLLPVGTHCSDISINLNFMPSGPINGTATTVARGDHNHLGQVWSGSNATGLTVQTTASNGVGLYGYTSSDSGTGVYGKHGAGSGITPPAPPALWGDSANNWGVLGTSNNYVGVVGISNVSDGVRGATNSISAFGVSGTAPVTGVIGIATNTGGSGVYGRVNSTGGNGVYGYSADWNGVRRGQQYWLWRCGEQHLRCWIVCNKHEWLCH